jgi:hypothetical protein
VLPAPPLTTPLDISHVSLPHMRCCTPLTVRHCELEGRRHFSLPGPRSGVDGDQRLSTHRDVHGSTPERPAWGVGVAAAAAVTALAHHALIDAQTAGLRVVTVPSTELSTLPKLWAVLAQHPRARFVLVVHAGVKVKESSREVAALAAALSAATTTANAAAPPPNALMYVVSLDAFDHAERACSSPTSATSLERPPRQLDAPDGSQPGDTVGRTSLEGALPCARGGFLICGGIVYSVC